MNALQELIDTADKLCNNLEMASMNDKKFCADVSLQLERYSWDMYRMANDLKQIKEYV